MNTFEQFLIESKLSKYFEVLPLRFLTFNEGWIPALRIFNTDTTSFTDLYFYYPEDKHIIVKPIKIINKNIFIAETTNAQKEQDMEVLHLDSKHSGEKNCRTGKFIKPFLVPFEISTYITKIKPYEINFNNPTSIDIEITSDVVF